MTHYIEEKVKQYLKIFWGLFINCGDTKEHNPAISVMPDEETNSSMPSLTNFLFNQLVGDIETKNVPKP